MARLTRWTLPVAAAALLAAAAHAAAPQGVTDTEVVIGTHQDLSGPITFWGVPVRNGMQMAVDEINAGGTDRTGQRQPGQRDA